MLKHNSEVPLRVSLVYDGEGDGVEVKNQSILKLSNVPIFIIISFH
jgi:hypothetical protein